MSQLHSLIVADGSSIEEARDKVQLVDSHPSKELNEPEAEGIGEEGSSQGFDVGWEVCEGISVQPGDEGNSLGSGH